MRSFQNTSLTFDSICLQLIQKMLQGIDEKLAYRPFDRTTYGPQLDLACTGDAVVHVHDRLKDLKEYLAGVVQDKGAKHAQDGDVEMGGAQ